MPDEQAAVESTRILIVDDNRDAANSLGRLLGIMGYEVRVVHTGEAALAQLEQFVPGVVLLDLGLPGMSGLEVARRVRERTEWDEVALVAVTGWGNERLRSQTLHSHFAAHLLKPVRVEVLEATLQQLIASPIS